MSFLCLCTGSVGCSHGAARSARAWAACRSDAPDLKAAAQPAAEAGAGLLAARGSWSYANIPR